jgi:hypothetical protein
MNPAFGLPTPPVDAAIPASVDTVVTGVMVLLTGGALMFALVHWLRTRRPTFLVLFLAGGAMMLLEPFVDTVGGCWHPANATRAFEIWGRPMPVWLCLTYFVFFGIGGGVTWLVLRNNPTPRTLWMLFAGSMIGDTVLEVTLLRFDTYVYYGNQPLVLADFPLWWAPTNALVDLAVAAILVRCAHAFTGARLLLAIPAAMAVSAAVNTVTGWPSWTAVNSDLGFVGTQLAGLATFAVAGLIVHGLGRWLTAAPGVPATVAVTEPVRVG